MNDTVQERAQGPQDGTLDCARLLSDPGSTPAQPNMRISIVAGHIADVTPLQTVPSAPRRLVLPALANAHDHGRMVRTSSLGAFGQPLESWLPFQGVLPGVDPYLCAATSFARAVRKGVAHLMVHYTRVQGAGSYLEEAAAVARAARDVGVRIGFAVALRDCQGIAYAPDATVLAALRPGIREAVAQRLSVRALSPAQQVDQVIVGGRTVVRAGQLTGLDEAALRAELAARMRSALASQSDAVARWRGSVQALAEDLGPFYRNSHFLGCC